MKALIVSLVFLFLLPMSAQAKTRNETVRCGKSKTFQVLSGDDLQVHLEECGGGGFLSAIRPAVRAELGVGSLGMTFGVDAEIAVRMTKSLELVGQVFGNTSEGKFFGTGFNGGIGGWLNSNWRLVGLAGGVTNRTSSWTYFNAGPQFGAQLDFVKAGRKAGGLDFALKVMAGPSWDADKLSGQWGAYLMIGWMAGN